MIVFAQTLKVIDLMESDFPTTHLSYLRSFLYYICADMSYYANRYRQAIRRRSGA